MFTDDNNRREFQRGIDPQAGKMKRHEDRLNLRRQIREGHLNKRRKALSSATDYPPSSSDSTNNTNNTTNNTNTISSNTTNSTNVYHYSSVPGVVSVTGAPIPPWVHLGNLQRFAEQIKSNNFESIFQGVQAIRQLLSVEDNPPIDQIFRADIVPNLLKILVKKIEIKDPRNKTPQEEQKCKLQFEASWALTNIASGDREYTRKLVDMGCVEAFMELLKNTKDVETADQAIWGLGNIAGDCPALRDKVLECGVLEYILDNLHKFPDTMKRNAVWTLSNFCRGKPSPSWDKISKVLNPLTQLISQTSDYDVIVDILWAISFLSEDRDDNITNGRNNGRNTDNGEEQNDAYQVDAVLRTGVIKYVISLVKHAEKLANEAWTRIDELKSIAAREGTNLDQIIPPDVRQKLSTSDYLIAPCVRIMGNIVSGSDYQTAEVVKAGFYEVIEICIGHRVRNIKKESCWALSNVVAGTSDQLGQFFKRESLVKKVVDLCQHSDMNVRKEAGWCLSNAICAATFDQIEVLVNCGFIEAMVGLLRCTQSDKVLIMAMEALEGCLTAYNKHFQKPEGEYNPFVERMEERGGLDALEEIQSLEVPERCYEMAASFVNKFWPDPNADSETGDDDTFTGDNGENSGENGDTFGFEGGDTQMTGQSDQQPYLF